MIFLRLFFLCFLSITGFIFSNSIPSDGINRLMEGNNRWANNQLLKPDQDINRLEATISKQEPFAIIVCCSDSRVPPVLIFDQGIGDLFVVRTAGNVIGKIELESIEYAAKNLSSCTLLVLGHENCGAISAVIENKTQDITNIAKLIEPSLEKAKKISTENLNEVTAKINALTMKNNLLHSNIINELNQNGKLNLFAGYYHLKTGKVDILDDNLSSVTKD